MMLPHVCDNPIFGLKFSLLLDIQAFDSRSMLFPDAFIDPFGLGDATHLLVPKQENEGWW
jgi:hypothetical protein